MYCILEMRENKIRSVRKMSQEYAAQLLEARGATGTLMTLETEFSYVDKALKRLRNRVQEADGIGETLSAALREAESGCRDFLSAFRAYLDHASTMLKQQYGKASPIYIAYFERIKALYEQDGNYAFTFILRNCAQHCNAIVHSLHEGRPSSDRRTLLAEYQKWEDGNRRFLSSGTGPIDLLSVFEEAFSALDTVHVLLMQYFLDHDDGAQCIMRLRTFADENYSRDSIRFYHLTNIVFQDGSDASVEDFRRGADVSFDAQSIDWDIIYRITDRMRHSNV